MKSTRILRVEDLIVKEISSILFSKVRDRKIGMVTVMSVDLSPDMRNAKIYISILGEEKDIDRSLKGLNRAVSFIRRELAHSVHLKYVPQLKFLYDQTPAYGEHMDQLFKDMKSGD